MALVARQPPLTRALGVPLGLLPHALLLLILIPCISLAALLLCEMTLARAQLWKAPRTPECARRTCLDMANAGSQIVYARPVTFGSPDNLLCAEQGFDLLASAEPGSLKSQRLTAQRAWRQ